jgi:hypothetical protein
MAARHAKRRKQRLFEQGVAALEALGLKQTYLCPLCGGRFLSEALATGELTLEHVPAVSRGGKAIILTCRPCNSFAGHEIDAEAARRDEMNQFMRVLFNGEPGEAGRATATWGNQLLRIEVSVDASRTVDLNVLKDSNDPARIEAGSAFMRELMESGKTDGYIFNITAAARVHLRKAQVSDLRTAYLACVARFGYRSALHATLHPIRERIAKPEEQILKYWWMPKNPLGTEQAIAVFIEDGISAVTFGGATVFLPWPSKPMESYLKSMELLFSGQTFTFNNGQAYAWPQSFEALLDHNWLRRAVHSEATTAV